MNAEQFIDLTGGRKLNQIGPFRYGICAPFLRRSSPSGVDENTSHRFGGCRKKIFPIVPSRSVRTTDQPEISLVNQIGRMQSISRAFRRQFMLRYLPKFVIYQWKESFYRINFLTRKRFQYTSYLRHDVWTPCL